MKGLTICWCRIEESENVSEELQAVKDGIAVATRLLTRVLERECDVSGEYGLLIESEGRLKNLLVV